MFGLLIISEAAKLYEGLGLAIAREVLLLYQFILFSFEVTLNY